MAERIKFYMDEHVPRAVTEGLRRRGVDVLTTQEADMVEADDEQHVALALRDGRVIVTQDADFLRLHAAGLPARCCARRARKRRPARGRTRRWRGCALLWIS